MKNILWIYNRPLDPHAGGTERITSLIMRGLASHGYNCLGMLVVNPDTRELIYQNQTIDNLSAFLKEHRVDVVINQEALNTKLLRFFLDQGGNAWHKEGGKLITCLHFDPKSPGLRYLYKLKKKKTVKDWVTLLKLSLFSDYYKRKEEKKAGQRYKYFYTESDFFVLLSKTHVPYISRIMGLTDNSRLKVINNPLTFDEISSPSILDTKKNTILVVARMDEYYKRISLVLKSWKEICKEQVSRDWYLKIVGDGPSLQEYKSFSISQGLERIEFLGQQNPDVYYNEAKLYMMTSSAEGWGLTLTESLERGVVPIVMDSSSVFHEIIEDGKNGFLTPDRKLKPFIEKVLLLMENQTCWRTMAVNALHSSERFSMENTIQRWEQLLK